MSRPKAELNSAVVRNLLAHIHRIDRPGYFDEGKKNKEVLQKFYFRGKCLQRNFLLDFLLKKRERNVCISLDKSRTFIYKEWKGP